MRDGWEAEAGNWAAFARTPGYDRAHDDVNLPALRDLLTFHSEHRPVEAYSRALEAAGLLIEAIREVGAPDSVVAAAPGQRRWQRIPLSLHLRAVKP